MYHHQRDGSSPSYNTGERESRYHIGGGERESQQHRYGHHGGGSGHDTGSEIYVVDHYHQPHHHNNPPPPPHSIHSNNRPASAVSSMYKPPESVISQKSKNKAGVVVETMSAPNPFCPHSKGVCCLLLLINLGLILVTLGFSVVLQLFDPAFVWYCGILFLIVGFIALIASLIFCVSICRERPHDNQLYWTHHWQKRIDI